MSPGAFDLDQFAPAPVSFKLRGVEYTVDGDPPTDQIARMLRIETAIADAEGLDATLEAVGEGCDVLNEMIRSHDPSQPQVKMGAQALLVTFALILHGSSVAAAVAEAISQPQQEAAEDGEPVATPPSGTDEAGSGEEAAPLVSATLSSERSSRSDEFVDGLLATGSG